MNGYPCEGAKVPEYFERTVSWNPWHGCHRVSEGCRNCYMFLGNENRGILDSNVVKRSKTNFDFPLRKDRNGYYVIKDRLVVTSMTSDFFIEEADEWRDEAWEIMRKRKDLMFMPITKRPERIMDCLPDDWGDGYENVRLAVSAENQEMWDKRIPGFVKVPAKHHDVFIAPIIGEIDISKTDVSNIECFYVGGEYGGNPRPCRYEWITKLREQCIENEISFFWRHCGETLIENGMELRFGNIQEQVKYCMLKNIDVKYADPLPKKKQTTLF